MDYLLDQRSPTACLNKIKKPQIGALCSTVGTKGIKRHYHHHYFTVICLVNVTDGRIPRLKMCINATGN
jgi:hypothetical protein